VFEEIRLSREAALDGSPGRQPWVSAGDDGPALKGRQRLSAALSGLTFLRDFKPRADALGYRLAPLRGSSLIPWPQEDLTFSVFRNKSKTPLKLLLVFGDQVVE
jgi:hypothetical protein